MRISRLTAPATLAIVLFLLLLAPWPVAADCQPAGPIEDEVPAAEVAFVGTVTAVDGAVATLAVREIWAGDVESPAVVRGFFDVIGGEDTGFGAGLSEDDRHWVAGTTYLVVPWVDGAVLRDSICTATVEWNDDLARLRPADARILVDAGPEGPSIPPTLLVASAVILVAGGASALAFRRR